MFEKLAKFADENDMPPESLRLVANKLEAGREMMPFSSWAGYKPVMAAMPDMTLDIAAIYPGRDFSLVSACALRGLTALYAKLLEMEKEQKTSEYPGGSSINAEVDFPFAARLLMARMPMLDPAAPDENAFHAASLAAFHKERTCYAGTRYRLIDVKSLPLL